MKRGEREREKDTVRERDTAREKEGDTVRERDKERDRCTYRCTDIQSDT